MQKTDYIVTITNDGEEYQRLTALTPEEHNTLFESLEALEDDARITHFSIEERPATENTLAELLSWAAFCADVAAPADDYDK